MRVVAKRPVLRAISEWLLGGGALLALVTGAIAFFDRDKDRIDTRHRDACANAHEAIRDDVLNPALSKKEQQVYLQRELRLAERCDKDVGQ